jgi:hypothetical protein
MLVGAFAMAAASIKPSGMLLLLLPVFASVERDWRAPLWVILGAAGIGILVFGPLAAWGGLEPFITTMQPQTRKVHPPARGWLPWENWARYDLVSGHPTP